MSRIIAGAAGGLRLASVPGTATRPTTDRVKESLFARLDAWGMLADARVLDLFAGSGALGCEAASRGAAVVDLVERDRKAFTVCQANARTVNAGLPGDVVTPHRRAVMTYLENTDGPWDLVLADPPYPLGEAEVTAMLEQLTGRLGPGGVVVVERSSRSPEPAWPAAMQRLEQSTHGETVLWFGEESG
ncbi:16S rRNA (guanine(966)-N(2))-methyltransferase RsmD [Kocuria coralli]|uniref:16S rRNA (Guanine(966)-N(2))-methyltransferase RsmD n=1 Tax=Kocuria coralli TaxID=1461025 RepID=A0A5J5L410_9MICC|nr:16S rRNA (guanine(966)-N(2))-methyltransferase RsmD [Kocuria coralli]KAA9395701.1 16S rRNA (guanine(966)-N(2))-methyltransferase RsmD [Kocuria coralli]